MPKNTTEPGGGGSSSLKRPLELEPVSLPSKIARFNYANVVTVVLGKDKNQQSFTVPRSILVSGSSFLEAACKPHWAKNQAQTSVPLPDTPSSVFEKYLHWLSTGNLELSVDEPIDLTRGSRVDKHPRYVLVFQQLWALYKMSDYLQDSRFSNTPINLWVATTTSEGYRATPPPYICNEAATSLPPSPLRRLIAYQILVTPPNHVDSGLCDEFKSDMIIVASWTMTRHLSGDAHDLGRLGRCYFHHHDDKCPGLECDARRRADICLNLFPRNSIRAQGQ